MRRCRGPLAACMAACFGIGANAPSAVAEPIPYLETAFSWGSPFPQGEDIRAIDFEGDEGYLVAAVSLPEEDEEERRTTLLRTVDGGRSWRQLVGPAARLDRVHALGGGRAVVEACDLLRTDDGGISFRRLPLPTATGRCTRGASFPSPDDGYVLGRDGGVAATADGGTTFSSRQPVPGVSDQTETARISFSGTDIGVAVRDGVIYRTGDGARSWTEVATARAPLQDVELSGQSGYAVGRAGTVLATVDGGLSWSVRPMRGVAPEYLLSVRCLDASTCLIVTDRGAVAAEAALLRTTDGGQSASVVEGSEGVTALDAERGPGRAIAGGLGGRIGLSSDAGRTFAPLRPVAPADALIRGPENTLHTSDGRGLIGRSLDGGRTWRTLRLPAGAREYSGSVSFSSRDRGLVPVFGPTRRTRPTLVRLLATSDGGDSWQTVRRDRATGPFVVLALPRGRVLAARAGGLSRSVNGGRSFRRLRSRALRGLRAYSFDRAGPAIAAVGERRAAISRDGGRAWRRLRLPRGLRYLTLDFVTARIGFVTGRGHLYRTRNGGRSWTKLLSVGARSARTASFSDARHGLVDVSESESSCGMDCYDFGSASVMRTDDGGHTWTPQFLRDADQVDGLAALGKRGAVVALGGGLIWSATAGRGPVRERLTLRLSRRRLARPGQATVSGSVKPPGRRSLELSREAGDDSTGIRTVRVSRRGTFRLTTRLFTTTRFVLQAGSDGVRSGAGSPVRRVTVGRR